MGRPRKIGVLTPRERSLVEGIITNKRYKEIAFDLGVTENTVKVYLSRLYDKLNVDRRIGLINWARDNFAQEGEIWWP